MGSMSSVLLTFPMERALFLKELGSRMYSVSSYFFGRQSTEVPVIIFFPVIFSLIVYWIIGLNTINAGKFFIFAAFLVLCSVSGNAIGIMAGSIFNDPRVASGIAPMMMMPLMIFAGLYVNEKTMPDWLGWL